MIKASKQMAIRLMAALYEAQARGENADMYITNSGDIYIHRGDVTALVDGEDSAAQGLALLEKREGWA